MSASLEESRFWPLVREALAGSRRDLTAMPLGRAVLLIAVPMILEMIAESIFAIVDIFWVSKLGANAIAAVGLTESLLSVVYAVAMGLSIGVGAVVSRRTGAKEAAGASRAAVQAILIGIALSVVVGSIGTIAGPRLLALMGASPAVQAIGGGYTRMIFAGSASVILLFLVNAAFRGAGDAALTMRALWLANGINIMLGPVFIFGLGPAPRLGVTGAAVATTIGRGIGVLYQLHNLRAGRGRLSVPRWAIRVDLETLRTILRLSGSAVIQMLISMASWVFLVRILSRFGSVALAGYTVALRVVLFALLPSWGLGNAAATLVGQNLGAGNPARAELAVWRAGFYNLLFLGGLGLLLFVCGHGVINLFAAEVDVVAEGSRCLRMVAVGFPLYAYAMVVSQAFNGAGDTWTPTWINLGCFWLFEIPVAYVLSQLIGFGPNGVYVAITLAFSAMALVSVVIFRRGRWKLVKV